MTKLWKAGDSVLVFECPACGYGHPFHIGEGHPDNQRWEFNGDFEKPTFSPSLMVCRDFPDKRCHSFVRDGRIQFLPDSWHGRSDTADLPDVEA